jgi:toxin HigB-1
MIINFRSKGTEALYHGFDTKAARKIPRQIWNIATRKLDMLNASKVLTDLKVPPANRLEALKGNLKGRFSIHINDRYRIIFAYKDGNAYEVEILDYH